MPTIRLLSSLLVTWTLAVGLAAAADDPQVLTVHREGNDPLLYLQLELPEPPALAASMPGMRPERLRARWWLTPEEGLAGPQVLYSVTRQLEAADGSAPVRVIARWPASDPLPERLHASVELWWPGEIWGGGMQQQAVLRRTAEPAQGSALVQAWQAGYRAELARRCRVLEDRELELLLYRRFFGSFPTINERRRGDEAELVEFFESVLGIDDLRAAIPASEDGRLLIEERSMAAPEAVRLPLVEAPEGGAVTPADDPSWYIPRSCATLGFTDLATMQRGLGEVTEQIERWSPGTWTRSAPMILEQQLSALGLDPITREALEVEGPVRITLAAWDPFFDAGTNLLAVLRADRPLALPDGVPYHHRSEDGHVLVLATGERLLQMAVAARDQERSLAQDPHYAAARARLLPREGAEERAFVFLSDHWLTNFISPRWRILDARRRELDARIRLVELLRVVRAAETRSAEPLDLVALGADPYLPSEVLDWLLAGLVLEDGAVVHRDLGGLGAHPAIDELPFERVTPSEHRGYERFRDSYQRRWRQMDPIALQVERVADHQWRTRLYVSPIGRQSDWRMLQGFVPPQKVRQRVVSGPPVAAGIVVTISTTTIAPMLGGIQLPLITTLQALSLDFAPTSFRPGTWLEEPRPQDDMSWLRLPAALVAPRLLFERLSPMVLNGPLEPSGETGIVELGTGSGVPGFPLLAWIPEGRGEVALAMQPAALRAMRDTELEYVEDPVSSDIHGFLDLRHGYLLRRKLWQLAVKDRSLADWRRSSRLDRIAAELGLEGPDAAPISQLLQRKVFPRPGIPAAVASSALPGLLEPGERSGHLYHSAGDGFDDLPLVITALERFDAYISIEPNALLFETHYGFDPAQIAVDAEEEFWAPGSEAAEPSTELDFDAAE